MAGPATSKVMQAAVRIVSGLGQMAMEMPRSMAGIAVPRFDSRFLLSKAISVNIKPAMVITPLAMYYAMSMPARCAQARKAAKVAAPQIHP